MLEQCATYALAIYLVQCALYEKAGFIEWGGKLAHHWACAMCFAFWPALVAGITLHGLTAQAIIATLATTGAVMVLDIFVTAAEGRSE